MGEHGVSLPCSRPQASSTFEHYAELKQTAIAVSYNFILHKAKLYFLKFSLLVAR